jgi:predicted ester cyclase
MLTRIISLFLTCVTLIIFAGVLQATADTEANKAVTRRIFEEVYGQGNLDVIDEVMAPDYTFPMDDPNPLYHNSEEYKQHVAESRAMFPDGRLIAEDQIAEGDKVVTRWTAVLTPQVTMTGILIELFVDGKIAGGWESYDELGLMQQLGAIPPMPDGPPFMDRQGDDYLWRPDSEVTGDPGDPEANKAIYLRAIEEVFVQGNVDAIDELVSTGFVNHDPLWPDVTDFESFKQWVTVTIVPVTDVQITIDDLITEGDKVAARWTCSMTDPATGIYVTTTGMDIIRVADGKIVEWWWAKDYLGMLKQLGVIPVPPPEQPEEEDFSNVFFTSLLPGLNMISLPLKPVAPYTARSFAEEIGATVVIEYDESLRRFVGFTLDAPDDGFPIAGGKGYIVNVPTGGTVAFTGAAWTNEPPVEAAPPLAGSHSAWAFVASGSVEGMSASDGSYTVTVKNLRTGSTAGETVHSSGYFAAAWADLSREAVIEAGDKVEVAVTDSSGRLISGPYVHEVTLDEIRNAVVNVSLRLGHIMPEKSALLQNYPNPFNPETWIPYHLRDANPVFIRIHNATGQVVRTLDLGYRDAGIYVSRSRAAYWDGKNEAREQVASGLYFYSITAGDFSAMRKMIVTR